MEQETFRAGVRPGGPTTVDEIKILVCYMLSKTGEAMSFEQMHDALSEQDLVNYFDIVYAVDALERTGSIKATTEESGRAVYSVTESGRKAAKTVTGMLPSSVRRKAAESARKLLLREKRLREIIAEISEYGDGFEVKLGIPQSGTNLAVFKLFCPTREEAELVRKRFLNDPVFIYKGVAALLTGDKNILGEIFPSEEKLF